MLVLGRGGPGRDSVVLGPVFWGAGIVLVLELLDSAEEYEEEEEELEDELDGEVVVNGVIAGPEPGSAASVVFTAGGIVIVGEEASLESEVPVELAGEVGINDIVAGLEPGSAAAVVFTASGIVIVGGEASLESEVPAEMTADDGGSVELKFAAVEDVSMAIGFDIEAEGTDELDVPVRAGVNSDVEGVFWFIDGFAPAVSAAEKGRLALLFELTPAVDIDTEE